MPGENIQDWSITAITNGSADTLINWIEGMARADVNNSARGMMAAIAKNRNINNGSIVTTGTPNAQAFSTGMGFSATPAGMRAMVKVGVGLANSGAVTLAMDTAAAAPVKSLTGNDLIGKELVANGLADFIFDGTNWILLQSAGLSITGNTIINTTTVTNQAAVALTGLEPGYDEYLIVFSNVVVTVPCAIYLRLSTDSGVTYLSGAADYRWSQLRSNDAGSVGAVGDTSDSKIEITWTNLGVAAGDSMSGELRLMAPYLAGKRANVNWQLSYTNNVNNIVLNQGCGKTRNTLVVNAVQFSASTGLLASGSFQTYGMRK